MYKIAIPSHKRSKVIRNKVLKFLESHKIDKKLIYIFVAEDEYYDYQDELGDYTIVVGAKGIGPNRMCISNYFGDNEFIVSIDDDVMELYDKGLPLIDLGLFITQTFHLLIANDLTLAGVYPSRNPFFSKNTITTDLRFIIGQFKCFINKKHLEKRDYELLEDYENTLKHYFHSGGVLRYNYILVKADYNKLSGGLKEYRTLEKKIDECNKFKLEYPNYCNIKKSGADISIIKNPNRDIIKSLWIGENLNELTELCIESWLKLDYQVILYIDKLNTPKRWDNYIQKGQLQFLQASTIMQYNNKEEILPFSDLFRYKLLFSEGGTWCDTDMFLLKRLPNDIQIISSEFTMQSGAFKSDLFFKANIGVLRFEKHSPILEYVINKIEKSKKVHSGTDRMLIFTKYVMKNCYLDVSPPSMYCPTAWWSCEEQYDNQPYSTKYNVEPLSNEYILEHSHGVHLWHSLTSNKHKIDFNTIPEYSLFSKLYNIVNS
tara:strand:- start:1370 stop:2833 length:1464 start_codon:yes stop_codon:yes gene_type:complete